MLEMGIIVFELFNERYVDSTMDANGDSSEGSNFLFLLSEVDN
jgi:hypothetical protein